MNYVKKVNSMAKQLNKKQNYKTDFSNLNLYDLPSDSMAKLKKKNDGVIINDYVKKGGYLEPYHFIDLNHNVMKSFYTRHTVPDPDDIRDDLLSGKINIQINCKNPIVIHGLLRNTIPSSSLRGLFRSNLAVLSYSGMVDDIEDRYLRWLRSLNRHDNLIRGKTSDQRGHSIYKNVFAGILKHTTNGWLLYVNPQQSNNKHFNSRNGYYALNLSFIQKTKSWREAFNVKIDNQNVFEALVQRDYSAARLNYKAVTMRIVAPFCKLVSFETNKLDEIVSIKEVGQLSNTGYLISGGGFHGKHTIYLVPVYSDEASVMVISDEDIIRYVRENESKSDYYKLPEINEEKPIFYINHKNSIDFGFTLLFPLHDDTGLHNRMPAENGLDLFDNAKAIFGCAYYRGRVSVSDFHMNSGCGRDMTDNERHIISVPKPRLFNNYFNENEYIRGSKEYWLREKVIQSSYKVKEKQIYDDRNARLFEAGSQFNGVVRFFNLSPKELGLLLWSIGLNKDCEQSIGAYKAYGYGRVKIEVKEVQLFSNGPLLFETFSIFDNKNVVSEKQQNVFIDEYQKELSRFLEDNNISHIRLKEFFFMKTLHKDIDINITAYSRRATRNIRKLINLKAISGNAKWLLLEPGELSELIGIDSIEQFMNSPTKRLREDPFYKTIVSCYRKLAEYMEIYKENNSYYVRKEIIDLIVNYRYFSVLQLYEAIHNNAYAYSHKEFVKYFDICFKEIQHISAFFKQQGELLVLNSAPKLLCRNNEYRLKSTPYDGADNVTIEFTLENNPASMTAYIDSVSVSLSYESFDIQDVVCIPGGGSKEISFSVSKVYFEQPKELQVYVLFHYIVNGKEENGIEQYMILNLYDESKSPNAKLKNPYATYANGGPVIKDEMFFGREQLIDEIINELNAAGKSDIAGQGYILFGQKRSGKSSVLCHIAKRLKSQENRYLVADLGNIGDGRKSERDFLSLLVKRIDSSIKREKISGYSINNVIYGIIQDENYRSVFSAFMELVNEKIEDRQIVIIIDEFTYIYSYLREHLYPDDFMSFFRAVIQNFHLKVIIVGQDFMPDFVNEYRNEFGSFSMKRLSYLERNDAAKLIRDPFVKYNSYNVFSDDAVARIIELTDGSAFYIMIICSMLINELKKTNNKEIDKSFVDQAVKEKLFDSNSQSRLDEYIFDPLLNDGFNKEFSDANIHLLIIVARISDNSGWAEKGKLIEMSMKENILEPAEKIQRLVFRDVLTEKEGHLVRIKVKLFSEWLLYRYGGLLEDEERKPF